MVRLSVFHSLAKATGCLSESTISLSKRIQECASDSCFQGIELYSSQVTKDVLDQCATQGVQVLTRIAPTSIDDAFRELDDLSTELSKVKEQDVGKVIRLIVINQPLATLKNNPSIIDYLSDILPVAAQFMETHPTIGQSKGERNAHGNPIDNHVLGVCHRLSLLQRLEDNNAEPNSNDDRLLQQILDILDVLPPTRLSLDESSLKILETSILNNGKGNGDAWDIEPLIQGIDHFDISRWKPSDTVNHETHGLYRQVWQWQKEVRVKETYVSCDDKPSAISLNNYFQRSF